LYRGGNEAAALQSLRSLFARQLNYHASAILHWLTKDMKVPGWRQWTMIVIFALVVMATALFAVRTVRRAIFWRQHRDETIRPWMSVPYVAHSHGVPPHVLYEALGLPHPTHDRRPLKQIAREQNIPVEQLIETLQKAIIQFRQTNLPPVPVAPERGRSP